MRLQPTTFGGLLRCGCFVGVYETRGGEAAAIVDERGAACPVAAHRVGARLAWERRPDPAGRVASDGGAGRCGETWTSGGG
jgi:hypothetical protein